MDNHVIIVVGWIERCWHSTICPRYSSHRFCSGVRIFLRCNRLDLKSGTRQRILPVFYIAYGIVDHGTVDFVNTATSKRKEILVTGV